MEQTEIENLRARLNAETGKLGWDELEPHHLRGALVRVAPELDLIDVAERMALDDRGAFEQWLAAGQVARVSETEAAAWKDSGLRCWAVVVAPWVLVQPVAATA